VPDGTRKDDKMSRLLKKRTVHRTDKDGNVASGLGGTVYVDIEPPKGISHENLVGLITNVYRWNGPVEVKEIKDPQTKNVVRVVEISQEFKKQNDAIGLDGLADAILSDLRKLFPMALMLIQPRVETPRKA